MKPAKQPRPRSARLIYALWTAGLGLLLVLGLVCWLFIAPMIEVRNLIRAVNRDHDIARLAQDPIESLGGQSRAARGLKLYLRFYNDGEEHRLLAISMLGRCGKAALPTLLKEASSSDEEARAFAIGSIGAVGPDAAECIPLLRQALHDQDDNIRGAAAGALGAIGPTARETYIDILPLMDDTSDFVRIHCALALSKIDPPAGQVLPVLKKAMGDSFEPVRVNAAIALGSLGPTALDATTDLKAHLNDDDPFVKAHVAEALWKITGDPAPLTPVLEQLMQSDHGLVRHIAERTKSAIAQAGGKRFP